jgi:hypothetical protein
VEVSPLSLCKAYSHTKMPSFHQGAGTLGAVSRARMISLFACLRRQLPDELLGIDSANLMIACIYGCLRWRQVSRFHIAVSLTSSPPTPGARLITVTLTLSREHLAHLLYTDFAKFNTGTISRFYWKNLDLYLAHTPLSDFEIMGGYFSPVSDAYKKAGLASSQHR